MKDKIINYFFDEEEIELGFVEYYKNLLILGSISFIITFIAIMV